MKKALSLILALVMCLSLCACGGDKAEDMAQKGIPLTIENCNNYLNINAYVGVTSDDTHPTFYLGDLGIQLPNGSYIGYLQPLMYYTAGVEGASTNFIYYDVVITIRIFGTYRPSDWKNNKWGTPVKFEQEVTIQCNAGGTGFFDKVCVDYGTYLHRDVINYDWEVVAISGYVEKA